jgi:signal transduction histidine kinase
VILHVIAVAVTSIVMSLALSWLLSLATTNIHNEAMEAQANSVARYLVFNADGVATVELPPELQGLYSQPYGRYSYAVINEQGRVVISSLRDRMALFSNDPRTANVEFLEMRRGSATISGASIQKALNGRPYWIQAGEDLANRDVIIDDIVADFFRNVGWVTLPILLALLGIDIAIFRRALRPLREASEIAKHIGPTRTDLRLPVGEIPSEVRPLVVAVNQALNRLDEGFRVQREFTADAAHELRTPLSILRTRIDTLDDRRIANALHQDIDSMGRIVGQLLDIAELDAFSANPNAKADLREVCVEVAQFIAPLALAQKKEIALLGAPCSVWVKGNSEMLYRAILNLAENAIKHTPDGTVVEFMVEEDGVVRVSDQGPGIADAERELIFRRFWRRDRNQPGSTGLGLSIVQRIAELHGATIKVENLPTGGAQFVLSFLAVENRRIGEISNLNPKDHDKGVACRSSTS